jgi:hypothetical protein
VDTLNPGFGDWLESGFEQQMTLAESIDTADQMTLAESIDTADEYVYAMLKFVSGFRDGHLNIRFDVDRSTAARWPGFFTTWRNAALVVHTVDTAVVSELAEGDQLRSCDGPSRRATGQTTCVRLPVQPGASGELGAGCRARLCRFWQSLRWRPAALRIRPRKS